MIGLAKLDTLDTVAYILTELDSLRFSHTKMFEALIINVVSILILEDKDYASDNGDGNDHQK